MNPEALLLDFDGTLVDWVRALTIGVEAGARHLAELHGLDRAEVASRALAIEGAVFDSHAEGWNLGGVSAPELQQALWRRALDEYGLDDGDAAALAETHWRAEVEGYAAFDDVAALLGAARAAGIRLALVTNGPGDVQRAKLAQVGLTDAFDAVLISAEVGVAKPDVRIFQAALAALDADPARAWHVGDSVDFDVAGAQAAGVGSILINRTGWERAGTEPVPDREIASLDELTALLAQVA